MNLGSEEVNQHLVYAEIDRYSDDAAVSNDTVKDQLQIDNQQSKKKTLSDIAEEESWELVAEGTTD